VVRFAQVIEIHGIGKTARTGNELSGSWRSHRLRAGSGRSETSKRNRTEMLLAFLLFEMWERKSSSQIKVCALPQEDSAEMITATIPLAFNGSSTGEYSAYP